MKNDDLLDRNLDGKENLHGKFSLGRGIVSGLLLAGIFNRIFRRPEYYERELNWAFAVGLLLPTLLYAWWVYYNLRQMQANRTGGHSAFGKPAVSVSLLIGIVYLYLNVISLSDTQLGASAGSFTPIIAMVGAILVIRDDVKIWRNL